MVGLAADATDPQTIMIKVSRRTPCVRVFLSKYLKADHMACRMGAKKRGRARQTGRTKGGMNTNLFAVTDAKGDFMLAGQLSDYTGAAALLNSLYRSNGFGQTGAMTLTGFDKQCQTEE